MYIENYHVFYEKSPVWAIFFAVLIFLIKSIFFIEFYGKKWYTGNGVIRSYFKER